MMRKSYLRTILVTLIQMSSVCLRCLPHEPIPGTEAHLISEVMENGRPHAEPYVILQDGGMWNDSNHANWPDGNVWVNWLKRSSWATDKLIENRGKYSIKVPDLVCPDPVAEGKDRASLQVQATTRTREA